MSERRTKPQAVWKRHAERALIYFGLAEEHGPDGKAVAPDESYFLIVFIPILFGTFVATRRDPTAGWIAAAAFLPGSVTFTLINLRRIHARWREAAVLLTIPAVFLAGALAFAPHASWPLAIGIAALLAAVVDAAKFLARHSRTRAEKTRVRESR